MASFVIMLVLPISIYLYLAYADWYWLFLLEARRLPNGTGVLLVLLPGGAILGAFLGAGALLRLSRKRVLRYLELGHFVLVASGAILLHHRLLYGGTTLSFRAGVLVSGRLGWALLFVAIGLISGALLVGHALREEARRMRPLTGNRRAAPPAPPAPPRRMAAPGTPGAGTPRGNS